MGARTSDAGRGAAAAVACAERLHRSSDVRAAFAAGPSAGSALLIVHGRRRADNGPPRLAVVAGRKVGNAVKRNRVKRRLRAAAALTALPGGFDLVVVGRTATADATFADVRRDLESVLARLVRRS